MALNQIVGLFSVGELFLSREADDVVQGRAGRLEVKINGVTSISPIRGVAVICHPHPQFGGSLDNKVVHTLARAFRDEGIAAVRFNFRGVGQSQGTVAEAEGRGEGELDDLISVLNWVREQQPTQPIWLAGFSFGGAIAAVLNQQHEHDMSIKGMVLISPAIGKYGSVVDKAVNLPCLVLQGEEDEVLPPEEVFSWVAAHSTAPIRLQRIADTGHFYHGQLVYLKSLVQTFLKELA